MARRPAFKVQKGSAAGTPDFGSDIMDAAPADDPMDNMLQSLIAQGSAGKAKAAAANVAAQKRLETLIQEATAANMEALNLFATGQQKHQVEVVNGFLAQIDERLDETDTLLLEQADNTAAMFNVLKDNHDIHAEHQVAMEKADKLDLAQMHQFLAEAEELDRRHAAEICEFMDAFEINLQAAVKEICMTTVKEIQCAMKARLLGWVDS